MKLPTNYLLTNPLYMHLNGCKQMINFKKSLGDKSHFRLD